jgi:O-acetyl-ADP-ribose deacetylase (regulator of RNase III)
MVDDLVYMFKTGQKLEIVRGDITQQVVDAIVNAANEYLKHGGGVAGIIARKGGEIIQRESDEWVKKNGRVEHGNPAYTSAGKLPARYVIHAVGPIWGSGNEDLKLSAAIEGSLELAEKLNLNSIAFPAISTGIFGFPKDRAAGLFMKAIKTYCSKNPSSIIKLVRIILFDEPTYCDFKRAFISFFCNS